jgi:hypothetical protein
MSKRTLEEVAEPAGPPTECVACWDDLTGTKKQREKLENAHPLCF